MSSDNRDVIQSASFGLGQIAVFAPKEFVALKPAAVPVIICFKKTTQALLKIVREPDARSDEKGESTANAIGALGKICLFHYDNAIITQTTVQEFLNYLPIKEDVEEAQNVHKHLFTQIIAKNANLIMEANLKALKEALIRIHEATIKSPELEIVKHEDLALLQQCLALFPA